MRYTVRPKAGDTIGYDLLQRSLKQSLPSGHVAVAVDSLSTGLCFEVCREGYALGPRPDDAVRVWLDDGVKP